MPDADPVEVAFAFARNALIQTSREPGWTQVAGRLLAAALEYAVQGVFIAGGFPVLAPKVRRYFDPSMTAHLQPADAEVIRAVWSDAGRSHADLDLSTIIGICAAVVDRLEALAGSPPPAGWSPPPVPASIGWAALSGADQQLLTRVRQGAQHCARRQRSSCSARGQPGSPGQKATTTCCLSSPMTSTHMSGR